MQLLRALRKVKEIEFVGRSHHANIAMKEAQQEYNIWLRKQEKRRFYTIEVLTKEEHPEEVNEIYFKHKIKVTFQMNRKT